MGLVGEKDDNGVLAGTKNVEEVPVAAHTNKADETSAV